MSTCGHLRHHHHHQQQHNQNHHRHRMVRKIARIRIVLHFAFHRDTSLRRIDQARHVKLAKHIQNVFCTERGPGHSCGALLSSAFVYLRYSRASRVRRCRFELSLSFRHLGMSLFDMQWRTQPPATVCYHSTDESNWHQPPILASSPVAYGRYRL